MKNEEYLRSADFDRLESRRKRQVRSIVLVALAAVVISYMCGGITKTPGRFDIGNLKTSLIGADSESAESIAKNKTAETVTNDEIQTKPVIAVNDCEASVRKADKTEVLEAYAADKADYATDISEVLENYVSIDEVTAEIETKPVYEKLTEDTTICCTVRGEAILPRFEEGITDNLNNHYSYGFLLANSSTYPAEPGEGEFILGGKYTSITFTYVPMRDLVSGGSPDLTVYADGNEIFYAAAYDDPYMQPVTVTLDVTGVDRIKFHIPAGSFWTAGPNGGWYIAEPVLFY